jgi:hypothetical protein
MSKSQVQPSRRGFVLGAAATGALTAAAVAVHQQVAPTDATPAAPEPPKPERGGGYRLSEHVQHYYRTTRV